MARALATRLASIVMVTMLVLGCDASFGPALPNGLACANVPPEVCLAKAQSLGFGFDPAVVAVEMTCTSTTCDAANGEVAVRIRHPDGTVDSQSMGWSSGGGQAPGLGPVPAPSFDAPGGVVPGLVPTCIGVPRSACLDRMRETTSSVPSGRTAVAVVIKCTAVCDAQQGDGDTMLTLDDGNVQTFGWSYSTVGGGQEPPIPAPTAEAS
jgi:hypothetical protein